VAAPTWPASGARAVRPRPAGMVGRGDPLEEDSRSPLGIGQGDLIGQSPQGIHPQVALTRRPSQTANYPDRSGRSLARESLLGLLTELVSLTQVTRQGC
jgi:hypothetical protein